MSQQKTTTSSTLGGNRPSVFEEAYEMMLGSVIIYIFSEMRRMARDNKLGNLTIDDLEPPLTAERTLKIIQSNKKAFDTWIKDDHEYMTSRLQALQAAHNNSKEQQQQQATTNSTQEEKHEFFKGGRNLLQGLLSISFNNSTQSLNPEVEIEPKFQNQVRLSKFMDDNSEEECVHAIVVNEPMKRVTIVFRGSVTQKDFLQDSKCAQKKVHNPVMALVKDDEEKSKTMPETVNVHSGFYEYLFLRDAVTDKTRLEVVLEDAEEELEKHAGFSLYCCGHSLGGALATLTGFYAACDSKLMSLAANHRIVVYSIGSPYCGNWKFRHAFQELERQRRLQYLRIANCEDLITLMPFAVPKATILSPALSMITGAGNLYKHVGIRLQIRDASKTNAKKQYEHSLFYPKEHQCEDDEEYSREIQDAMDAGKSLISSLYFLCKREFETVEKFHSCVEYETRLESTRENLSKMTLDDLYNDQQLVGQLFTEGFKPSLLGSGVARTLRHMSFLTRRSSGSSSVKKNADNALEQDKNEDEMGATLEEAALAIK